MSYKCTMVAPLCHKNFSAETTYEKIEEKNIKKKSMEKIGYFLKEY